MMKKIVVIIYHLVLYELLGVGNTCGSSDWHALGNSTYRYVATLRPFQDARDYCQKFGGDLAQLKTQEINEFVQTLIGNQSVWFGLIGSTGVCAHQWIDGSLLGNSFSALPTNETATCHEYKHCIQLGHGTWSEHECFIPIPSVCERSDFHRVIERPADVYLWVSDPFAPVSDLRVLVIAHQQQEKIDCKHVTYDDRDSLTQRIASSVVPLSISSSYVVHELLLDDTSYYHASGKLVCGMSSEGDDENTTIVSALHLVPDREAQTTNGRFTLTAYPGMTSTMQMTKLATLSRTNFRFLFLTWTFYKSGNDRGNTLLPSLHETVHRITPVREQDQGTYITRIYNDEYRRFGFNGSAIRLIVPDCAAGRWGPPLCLGVCDPCYNGGICHDLSGSCICPPGFAGKNCLMACGEHRFGSNCDITCGLDQEQTMPCAGSQICRPDPYGCNCLSGYTGIYCNETCLAGQYGVDCLQNCHCSSGSDCDIFSGECPGDCEDGWSGPSCQVPEVCPEGFYGKYCGKVCHCTSATPCDRQSGYCIDEDGTCADGYVTEPSRNTYCDIYVGCFDSCSKTCYCSQGSSDCNSVTGMCFSGRCLSGWTGPTCQIGGGPTTIVPNFTPSRLTNIWEGGHALWALFGTTLVLLLVCLAVLFGMRIYRRMTSSKPPPTVVSSQSSPTGTTASPQEDYTHYNQIFSADVSTPDHTYQPHNKATTTSGSKIAMTYSRNENKGEHQSSPGQSDHTYQPLNKAPVTSGSKLTMTSSLNEYVDEDRSFSAGPGHTYQPLYKGPNTSRRNIPGNEDQNEYEMPINPSEGVYQNNSVKVI